MIDNNYESPPLTPVNNSKKPMMLVIVGGAVIIAAIIAAFAFGWIHLPSKSSTSSGGNSSETTKPVAKYEATVKITANGFEPVVLNVKPRTRVYFQNEDTANHRITTSTRSPDATFGNSNEIVPSTGYVFTFVDEGEYSYYDGNNVKANGKIVVQLVRP